MTLADAPGTAFPAAAELVEVGMVTTEASHPAVVVVALSIAANSVPGPDATSAMMKHSLQMQWRRLRQWKRNLILPKTS